MYLGCRKKAPGDQKVCFGVTAEEAAVLSGKAAALKAYSEFSSCELFSSHGRPEVSLLACVAGPLKPVAFPSVNA